MTEPTRPTRPNFASSGISSAKRLGRLTILGIRNSPFGTASSSGLCAHPPYRLHSRPAHATGRGSMTTPPSLRRRYETAHNPRTGRALPERRAAEDQPAEDQPGEYQTGEDRPGVT